MRTSPIGIFPKLLGCCYVIDHLRLLGLPAFSLISPCTPTPRTPVPASPRAAPVSLPSSPRRTARSCPSSAGNSLARSAGSSSRIARSFSTPPAAILRSISALIAYPSGACTCSGVLNAATKLAYLWSSSRSVIHVKSNVVDSDSVDFSSSVFISSSLRSSQLLGFRPQPQNISVIVYFPSPEPATGGAGSSRQWVMLSARLNQNPFSSESLDTWKYLSTL